LDGLLLAAMTVVGLTGVMFGMTGFGFALISVPPLLLLYEPDTVVAVTIGVTLLPSAMIVGAARRELEPGLILKLLPGALPGLLVGAWILAIADPNILKVVAGALVTGYAVLLLLGVQPHFGAGGWATTLAGAASGTLATSTGLSAPPVVILFQELRLPTNAFRASISAYFVVLNLIGFAILLASGTLDRGAVVTTAALAPAALLGALAGNRLVRRLSAPGFRRLTVFLLMLTGVMGIVTALAALA
jgi:uncharacterized membrane protein YfcA